MDFNEFNRGVIAEFRANDGVLSGDFAGADVVLLHTLGAKSGAERINPLMSLPQGDDIVIFASKGGAPTNPDWYHNLVANPDVTVEVGTGTRPMRARVARGEERDRLYATQAERFPQFADYARATDRTIPVVVLSPA